MRVCVVLAVIMADACSTSSHVLLGPTHPPLPSDGVQVYLEPVQGRYDEIAVVAASSGRSLSLTSEAKAEVVMQRLKSEAARLGANGILLEQITDGRPDGQGFGVAPELTRDHASIGVGFNATGLLGSRYGRAIAIYIAPAGTGH